MQLLLHPPHVVPTSAPVPPIFEHIFESPSPPEAPAVLPTGEPSTGSPLLSTNPTSFPQFIARTVVPSEPPGIDSVQPTAGTIVLPTLTPVLSPISVPPQALPPIVSPIAFSTPPSTLPLKAVDTNTASNIASNIVSDAIAYCVTDRISSTTSNIASNATNQVIFSTAIATDD